MKPYLLSILIIFTVIAFLGAVVFGLVYFSRDDSPEPNRALEKAETGIAVAPFGINSPSRYDESLTVSAFNETLSLKPLKASAAEKIAEGDNVVKYKDAYQNTDVVQTRETSKLKEDIVLKKPGHPGKFEYQIKIDKYDFEMTEAGDIHFYSKGEKGNDLRKKFTIPAPFMIDANENRSPTSDVKTTITESGLLTIEPSREWLAEAAYPVILDPTVEINILNLYSHPQEGDDWEVSFATTGKADLKIIPDDQATIDDDQFTGLWCGSEERTPQILKGDVIFYPAWECSEVAKIIHYTLKAGKHTLRFEFGDKTAYAYNDSFSWSTASTGVGWTVPQGVTSIDAKCWGGGGGGGGGGEYDYGGYGGGGGAASSTISVTPEETLTIMVGGGGGGGASGGDEGAGGGGGGYGAIKRGSTILIQCAGGGGGGGDMYDGGGNGGAGGGTTGVSGSDGGGGDAEGGGGGTQSAGGSGGSGTYDAPDGSSGSANTGGGGGDDGSYDSPGGTNGGGAGGGYDNNLGGGGGGGAGKYGGGGGGGGKYEGGGGGGGGSSFGDTAYSGSGRNAGNNGDDDYTGSAGYGGNRGGYEGNGSSGNDGLVVISYFIPLDCDPVILRTPSSGLIFKRNVIFK